MPAEKNILDLYLNPPTLIMEPWPTDISEEQRARVREFMEDPRMAESARRYMEAMSKYVPPLDD